MFGCSCKNVMPIIMMVNGMGSSPPAGGPIYHIIDWSIGSQQMAMQGFALVGCGVGLASVILCCCSFC